MSITIEEAPNIHQKLLMLSDVVSKEKTTDGEKMLRQIKLLISIAEFYTEPEKKKVVQKDKMVQAFKEAYPRMHQVAIEIRKLLHGKQYDELMVLNFVGGSCNDLIDRRIELRKRKRVLQ
jgi:hypothetical protein